MSERKRIIKRISSLCGTLFVNRYTRWKLRTDPLYEGVFEEVKNSQLPLLDIGCGMGILGMYLRERGWKNRVAGFDYDPSKIAAGRKMIAKGGYSEMTLEQGDARTGLPDHQGDVTILDILQFFQPVEQAALLKAAGSRIPKGGSLIVRSGLWQKNLRFRVTWLADLFAKATFWMKAAPVHYPSAEFFREMLGAEGLEVEIRPFWGKTPFNNYLILAKRAE